MNAIDYFSYYIDNINVNEGSIYEDLNLLLAENALLEKRDKWTTYQFKGFNVPRATEIINDTINKDYLNKWAAKLGDKYSKSVSIILDTGSLAHQYIEDFIEYGKIFPEKDNQYPKANQMEAMRAYHNFKNFWIDMKNKGYVITPVYIEKPFATPWYGGTIDFVANIDSLDGNNGTFILDFKTSKKISYSHFLQLSLYKYAYQNYIVPGSEVQGIGIIRVDKKENKYEYLITNKDDPNDLEFMSKLYTASVSMLNWYYNMNVSELALKEFRQKYIERGGFDGVY